MLFHSFIQFKDSISISLLQNLSSLAFPQCSVPSHTYCSGIHISLLPIHGTCPSGQTTCRDKKVINIVWGSGWETGNWGGGGGGGELPNQSIPATCYHIANTVMDCCIADPGVGGSTRHLLYMLLYNE